MRGLCNASASGLLIPHETWLGNSLIRSRATDSQGNVQPMLAEWNFRGYQVNSIHSVPITVREPR